jgi:hypothetical protein
MPSLTSLREMCLRIVLSPQAFAPIALYPGATMRKLGIMLSSYDLPQAVSLLGRFRALEELRLEVPQSEHPDSDSSNAKLVLDLPSLRSLEIAP